MHCAQQSFSSKCAGPSWSYGSWIYNYMCGTIMVVIVRSLDLQLPVQSDSVPITTNVVSSVPVHGKVYSIQHYVIKFGSYLRHAGSFLWFPPPIKLTATILLKVTLNAKPSTWVGVNMFSSKLSVYIR